MFHTIEDVVTSPSVTAQVNRLAYSLQPQYAEDYVSTAQLKVIKNWPQLSQQPMGYVVQTLLNAVRDAHQFENRRIYPDTGLFTHKDKRPCAMSMVTGYSVIAACHPQQRLVLYMHGHWGFKYSEIASILGWDTAHVYRLVQQAKAVLRSAPAFHNPVDDIFVALVRRHDTWHQVGFVDRGFTRAQAREVFGRSVGDCTLIGSDLKSEEIGHGGPDFAEL